MEHGIGFRDLDDCDAILARARPGSRFVVLGGGLLGCEAARGLAVDSGILVDDRLATRDDRVHAIGDCAQHAGAVAGVVQPGWEQAAVLADLLTGADPAARYRGTCTVTRLKARDVDLATVGDPTRRCNTVTKGALVTAWRAGASSPPALARATRAGTGCGSCGDTVDGICSWLERADPSLQEEAA